MHDHDQRFKTLIQEFFAEFLQLFFATWAKRFDLSRIEWLDKEVFLDPPQGNRSVLDLVARLRARQQIAEHAADESGDWLALVHIEIESPDKAAPLRPRMYRAYHALRVRHALPVLPIGLFLRVGLNGLGVDVYEEHFWELRPIRFEYLYVGLPALDALEYLEKDNWLGWALASLMKIPKEKAAELGAEALRRIAGAPLSDQKRFLLGECVEAYLPLDETQQREFDALVITNKYAGVQAMNKTTYEKGLEKGLEDGETRGRRATIRELLEARFGTLPANVVARIEQLTLPELRDLGKAVLRAQSLADLGLEK